MRVYVFFKRVIDLGLIFLLSPIILMLVLPVGVLVMSQNLKMFYVQTRVGYRGEKFSLYKFRTLKDNEEPFRFGRTLRQIGLDELPQLWNIIKGEMTIIGPRPLLPEYMEKYSSFQKQRHNVKPGLTGLAQIKGFNDLSWEHKFRYDVFYVTRMGWKLDAYVFIRTILSVLLFSRLRNEVNTVSTRFGE